MNYPKELKRLARKVIDGSATILETRMMAELVLANGAPPPRPRFGMRWRCYLDPGHPGEHRRSYTSETDGGRCNAEPDLG